MRIFRLTPGPRLCAVLETAARATSGFLRSSGPAQAASLAFYALLSCIPLFFVMLVGYGLIAGAGFCVSAAFTAVVAGLPRYHLVYGPLSGAILFLLWLDYNAWVLLWGAWFVRGWQKRQPPPQKTPPSGRIVVGPWLPGFRAARSAPKPRS